MTTARNGCAFTRTIGQRRSRQASAQERAVKAVADITESPAGLLLTPNEEAQLLAARWHWPTMCRACGGGDYAIRPCSNSTIFIVDLDEARAGIDHHGEASRAGLAARGRAPGRWCRCSITTGWSAWSCWPVRPCRASSTGRTSICCASSASSWPAIWPSRRAAGTGWSQPVRRIQPPHRLRDARHQEPRQPARLLARNAEKHADNPAFRADMLVTLRNSADKLNALLARCRRYGRGRWNAPQAGARRWCKAMASLAGGRHPVLLTEVQRANLSWSWPTARRWNRR
jgi:hypothetical protein